MQAYDPTVEFTVASAEWQALLTLAAQPDPAKLVTEQGWSATLFASPGAAEVYLRVARAEAPLHLTRPTPFADLEGLSVTELPPLQARLAALARWRALTALKQTLAEQIREEMARRGGGQESDPGSLLEMTRKALTLAQKTAAAPSVPESASLITLGELAERYWDQKANRAAAAPTGFPYLDKALGGGLQEGRLALLLGGPGSGKTTWANQVAEGVANSGRPVLYLTLEETEEALRDKTIARLGQIDYDAVVYGHQSERVRIDGTLADLTRRPSASRLLYAADSGMITVEELRTVAKRHFERYHEGGLGLLVIDYLQRWSRGQRSASSPSGRSDLRETVSLCCEQLRELARELKCSVLALSSQNRISGYGNGGNVLVSAKESGDIEYACDVLCALGEPNREDSREAAVAALIEGMGNECKVLALAKNRQGRLRRLPLAWQPSYQRFFTVEMPDEQGLEAYADYRSSARVSQTYRGNGRR